MLGIGSGPGHRFHDTHVRTELPAKIGLRDDLEADVTNAVRAKAGWSAAVANISSSESVPRSGEVHTFLGKEYPGSHGKVHDCNPTNDDSLP